jgi:Fe-S-cluster containining protein
MPQRIKSKPREADFYDICKECPEGCCTGVRPPLTLERQRKISEYVRANGIALENLFESRGYMFPRETEIGRCIFLDETTKKCKIHPVKPETCLAGPITFDVNTETGKIEWFLKTDKICLLAAPLHKNRAEYAKHVKAARKEILRLLHGLDADALRAVLKVEEPDTVKVGEDKAPSDVLAKLKS